MNLISAPAKLPDLRLSAPFGSRELNKERKVAFRAALEAGNLMRHKLGRISKIDYKSAFNIVTDVDKACEETILEILKSEFPADAILAEEGGTNPNSTSNRRWLIDPLDGTTNYAHAYPFFCVSIGLEENGQMIMGVVFNPISDELFWAEAGHGAFLNDEPLRVSTVDSLEESLLATGFPPDSDVMVHNNMREFNSLTDVSHGVRRDGSAALDLCFVAAGRLDAFWEWKLKPWDIGAGSLIVTEAGGKVSDLSDGRLDMSVGHILASNGHIHSEIIEILRRTYIEVAKPQATTVVKSTKSTANKKTRSTTTKKASPKSKTHGKLKASKSKTTKATKSKGSKSKVSSNKSKSSSHKTKKSSKDKAGSKTKPKAKKAGSAESRSKSAKGKGAVAKHHKSGKKH